MVHLASVRYQKISFEKKEYVFAVKHWPTDKWPPLFYFGEDPDGGIYLAIMQHQGLTAENSKVPDWVFLYPR